jgi:hypothetical protein
VSLAAISVDLDEIPHYFALHGLTAPGDSAAAHAVADVALPRIATFAAAQQIPITLFAVGQDLARSTTAAALRALSDRGHAVENHSFSHRYDLVRLPRGAVQDEIARGAEAIAQATGRAPIGFRAPGYAVSDDLFDALEDLGVAFDSSVFPCPSYYTAKALVLAAQRARGRRSAAILDAPRVLAAPACPYRPGRPYWRRGTRRLLELPIQVTPWLRLPVIGTSVALAGPAGARLLARWCSGAPERRRPAGPTPLVQLELHGMDFLDQSDGLEALSRYQPELRVPLGRRLAALSAFIEALSRAGRCFVGLAEAAEALAKGL